MLRVLQVVNNMDRAGLETVLMNYMRRMDRQQIQFDFLTHRSFKSDYDDEILSLGGCIYHAPRLYPQNYPAYFRWTKRFFAQHPEYGIIHSHIDSMSYLPLLAARRAGVPVRIAHSHSTAIDSGIKKPLKLYFRSKLPSEATHFFACGKAAGEFLFPGRECTVIPNAIESRKFAFDPAVRREKRSELGLDGRTVIGVVGTLRPVKNHSFLFGLLAEAKKHNPSLMLMVVGDGPLRRQLEEQTQRLGIKENVLMLGLREDTHELYQAMDAFVMPSLFEGIPMAGLEAQFAGLPCVFSDRVPQEVSFGGRNRFVSLENAEEEWIRALLECAEAPRVGLPEGVGREYDIDTAAAGLTDIYLDLHEKFCCAGDAK